MAQWPLRGTTNGGRSLPFAFMRKGVRCMVTYDSMFTYTLVVIAIVTLVLACKSRDK